jgi:hypothetical protein
MLRLEGLCIAAGLLVVAAIGGGCALTEPLPPAGTVPVQLQVQNNAPSPAELTVTVGAGPIPGAVQPPSVPPGTSADVVFHVPLASNWEIQANGQTLVDRSALRNRTGVIRNMGLTIERDGGTGWWCNGLC